MSGLRLTYLILAIWGTVHPMYFLITWLRDNGFDLMGMVQAWNANTAGSGLFWDLVITAVALTFWIVVECSRRRDRLGLVAIPATFAIGVSCGVPLYLFLRSRQR